MNIILTEHDLDSMTYVAGLGVNFHKVDAYDFQYIVSHSELIKFAYNKGIKLNRLEDKTAVFDTEQKLIYLIYTVQNVCQ